MRLLAGLVFACGFAQRQDSVQQNPRNCRDCKPRQGDLRAGNGHAEGAVTGVTDLFTKVELDPWAEALGESFSSRGISWELRDIQYEEDTGFYHYTWDWEVLNG